MRRIAILTGRSNPGSCALTPAQTAFLEAVRPPECDVIWTAFPYGESGGYREVHILLASLHNAFEVAGTYSAGRVRWIGERIESLRTGVKRLTLITGSCGLQMVNAAWPLLTAGCEIRIIALGPVCLSKPRMPIVAIRGRSDVWSLALFGGPIDSYSRCGHLSYWESDEVRELVGRLVR